MVSVRALTAGSVAVAVWAASSSASVTVPSAAAALNCAAVTAHHFAEVFATPTLLNFAIDC